MITLTNYKITAQIHESFNSLVYRGIQLDGEIPVILKVLKADYPTQPNSLATNKNMKLTAA